ncbi:MAG: hypothetical protein OEZ13_02385 [Spirochaetia bacterium]|nr:hypothetical protein [Spirochaetia bacterium]
MRKIILLIFFYQPFSAFLFADTRKETVQLTLHRNSEKYVQKMNIVEEKDHITIDFFDENGESTKTILSGQMKPLEVFYFNKKKDEYMKLFFNYDKKEIYSTGKIEEEYDLDGTTYDATGATFYIFSKILPAAGKNYNFYLLQSKEERVVQMYLRYVSTENIFINGENKLALKYETGLESSILSLVWPYKYYYWFSAEDKKFLRYKGPFGHENEETTDALYGR